MRRRLYANPSEKQAAWRKRRRERERQALTTQQQEQVSAPVAVPTIDLLAELRRLAEQVDRGCSHLRMEAKPWQLGAVDASRAFELLHYVQSELRRLAG